MTLSWSLAFGPGVRPLAQAGAQENLFGFLSYLNQIKLCLVVSEHYMPFLSLGINDKTVMQKKEKKKKAVPVQTHELTP